jgi:hypothetical protein
MLGSTVTPCIAILPYKVSSSEMAVSDDLSKFAGRNESGTNVSVRGRENLTLGITAWLSSNPSPAKSVYGVNL